MNVSFCAISLQFHVFVVSIESTQASAKNIRKLWKVYLGLFKTIKYVIYRLKLKAQPHFPVRSSSSAINNVLKCCSHQSSTSQGFSYYYLFVDLFVFFSPSIFLVPNFMYTPHVISVVDLVECLANARKHTNTW